MTPQVDRVTLSWINLKPLEFLRRYLTSQHGVWHFMRGTDLKGYNPSCLLFSTQAFFWPDAGIVIFVLNFLLGWLFFDYMPFLLTYVAVQHFKHENLLLVLLDLYLSFLQSFAPLLLILPFLVTFPIFQSVCDFLSSFSSSNTQFNFI